MSTLDPPPVTTAMMHQFELRWLRDRLSIVKIEQFSLDQQRRQIEERIAQLEDEDKY